MSTLYLHRSAFRVTNPINTDYPPTYGRVYGIKAPFCNTKTKDLILLKTVPWLDTGLRQKIWTEFLTGWGPMPKPALQTELQQLLIFPGCSSVCEEFQWHWLWEHIHLFCAFLQTPRVLHKHPLPWLSPLSASAQTGLSSHSSSHCKAEISPSWPAQPCVETGNSGWTGCLWLPQRSQCSRAGAAGWPSDPWAMCRLWRALLSNPALLGCKRPPTGACVKTASPCQSKLMEAPADPPEPWGTHINTHINTQGCFYYFPSRRGEREDNVNLVLEFLPAVRMLDGGSDTHFPGKCSQGSVWSSSTAWRGHRGSAEDFVLL